MKIVVILLCNLKEVITFNHLTHRNETIGFLDPDYETYLSNTFIIISFFIKISKIYENWQVTISEPK